MRSSVAQSALAALLLAGVTLGCFQQLATHPNHLLVGPQGGGWNDLTSYFIPSRNYPRLCMEQFGQWPLWNPYSCSGVPFLGNPQSALFYPPNWLCWWFDARDVLSWIMVAHHWFAGVGTFLLCRRYGFAWLSSLIGGSVFLAAPYLVAQTGEGHYAQICVVAWLPWAFLAFEDVRAGIGGVPKLAAVVALSFFAGHGQEVYYLVVILSALVIVDAAIRWRAGDRVGSGKLLLRWLATGGFVIALVVVDLVPMLVYSRHAVRATGLTSAEAAAISMDFPNLFQLLNPFALGGPGSYAGRDRFFWETLCSFGLIPLVLSIVGVTKCWKRYPVQRLTWFWFLALGFALGNHAPVFTVLFHVVPGLSLFRVPSRILFFSSLATAVLAAAGADALLVRSSTPGRFGTILRRGLLGVVAAVLVLLCFDPIGDWLDQAAGVGAGFARTLASRTIWAWLSCALALVFAAERWPSWAQLATASLLVLVAVQLALYTDQIVCTIPTAALRLGRPVAAALTGPTEPSRVLARQELLSDQTAWERGIHRAQGYDPIHLARYTEFFTALTGKADSTSDVHGFSSLNLHQFREHLLDLLNIRFAVLAAIPPERLGWQLVTTDSFINPFNADGRQPPTRSYLIFENPQALPRAFIVGQAKVLERGQDRVQALVDLDPRKELLLDADSLPPGPRAEFAPATIIEYAANRVVIETDLAAPGYLVVSDTWYPGWTATDNEEPIPILPANVAFRAVPLSAGMHRVVFQFRSPGLWIGAVVSATAWIGLIAGLASIALIRRHRG